MVLRFENVTRYFGGLAAVKDVSFQVESNQILGLIGPNGSGKTTCFNLITGVHKPTSGRIEFDGKVISGMPSHKIARMGIARTFQISSVFPDLTAFENIVTAHHCRLSSNLLTGLIRTGRTAKEEKYAEEHSEELLDFVGLAGKIEMKANSLTSADQRRLMIAIALATNPKLLMLDEPCAGMVEDERAELIQLIRKVCDSGIPVLLVEHHMKMIMEVCHHVVVLNLGEKNCGRLPGRNSK